MKNIFYINKEATEIKEKNKGSCELKSEYFFLYSVEI